MTLEEAKDHIARYRALIVRRNAKDLADWLGRAKSLYGMMGADVTETPARIKWPSGAEFWLGHLDDANAYTAYQGQEFQRIIFEELTLIEKDSVAHASGRNVASVETGRFSPIASKPRPYLQTPSTVLVVPHSDDSHCAATKAED